MSTTISKSRKSAVATSKQVPSPTEKIAKKWHKHLDKPYRHLRSAILTATTSAECVQDAIEELKAALSPEELQIHSRRLALVESAINDMAGQLTGLYEARRLDDCSNWISFKAKDKDLG